ncbi:MAG: efflux RND transporter periplasmic adaptor subunit [Terriglobales bacterium]
MSRISVMVIVALVVIVAASGCSSGSANGNAAGAPAANATPPPAAIAASSEDAAGNTITSSGPIVVENQLDVTALRDGVVAQILADTGKMVRKGDLLAKLDDRQLASDLEAAQANLRALAADVKNWEADVNVLEADLSRARKMWDAQILTKEQLDHAEFKVVADRFELERERQNYAHQQDVIRSLELELEKTHITAPFEGVVARRYVRLGQRVASGDRLFWVTATAPLRVKFTLPEQYASAIRNGESIEVVSIDSPSVNHTAKVIQISPVIDPSSGTIEVLAEITGPAAGLRPGMTANVRFTKPR